MSRNRVHNAAAGHRSTHSGLEEAASESVGSSLVGRRQRSTVGAQDNASSASASTTTTQAPSSSTKTAKLRAGDVFEPPFLNSPSKPAKASRISGSGSTPGISAAVVARESTSVDEPEDVAGMSDSSPDQSSLQLAVQLPMAEATVHAGAASQRISSLNAAPQLSPVVLFVDCADLKFIIATTSSTMLRDVVPDIERKYHKLTGGRKTVCSLCLH